MQRHEFARTTRRRPMDTGDLHLPVFVDINLTFLQNMNRLSEQDKTVYRSLHFAYLKRIVLSFVLPVIILLIFLFLPINDNIWGIHNM